MEKKKISVIGLKTVYSILSFLWGIAIAGCAAIIVLFLFNLFFDKSFAPIDILTASIKLMNDDTPGNYRLINLQANLILKDSSFSLVLLYYLKEFVLTGLFAYLIFITRKVILTVLDGNPFIKENGVRIRIIGTILIAVPLFTGILSLILNSMDVFHLNRFNNLNPVSSVSLNINIFDEQALIFGFLFLVISEVFRVGVKMKEEQDLTV